MFCTVHVLKLLLFVAILPDLRGKQLLRHFSRWILAFLCVVCLSALGVTIQQSRMRVVDKWQDSEVHLGPGFTFGTSSFVLQALLYVRMENNICLPAYTHGILLSQTPACRCSTGFVVMSPWVIVPHWACLTVGSVMTFLTPSLCFPTYINGGRDCT